MTTSPLVAVVGATASGKSDLAVDMAVALGGEVVNSDAMQLYRGMDIGTAKLTVAQRRGVAHHLLDVLDVWQSASVAEFQEWARAAIADIWRRDRLPVLAGGSALYTRAVIDRFEFPGTDPALRAELEAEMAVIGTAAMHARLRSVDPEAADAILPTNGRRIVRALEVVTLTGRSFAARLPPPRYWHEPTVQVAIDVSREELDARVAERVDRMWAAGLVDEVAALVDHGLPRGRTAARALGYAQVLGMLEGRWSEQQAKALTVAATRRFVRRQDAWFRQDDRVHWLAPGPSLLERAVHLVRAQAPTIGP